MESVHYSGGDDDAGVRYLEGSIGAWHFQIAIYFAFGFFFLRLFLDTFVFQRIAVWLLSSTSAAPIKINDAATRAKIVKCKESLWKFLYYGACEIFVLKFLYHEPWAYDVKLYFHAWPNQELNFFRIGAIILALHDASDVFMETAKIFKYSEKEFGASVCFALFAISWLLLRLIYFPFWIIRATSIELVHHLDMAVAEDTIMYYSFNTMLLMLLVFHIYWWYLICAMIVRLLKNRGKVGEDIRSDSEDDE
ncbi:unnamed protein product [Eruca vesicaria subsp. sativa]|uniref:TLC domain-containing protein n=1 Tax=Eruca vesicaria subsp. sativa TaxID=29727 RepID=A0ABC8M9Z5_ERUVS|nr:unnamed protein product [Eruca vesicaria subsp. sativa]